METESEIKILAFKSFRVCTELHVAAKTKKKSPLGKRANLTIAWCRITVSTGVAPSNACKANERRASFLPTSNQNSSMHGISNFRVSSLATALEYSVIVEALNNVCENGVRLSEHRQRKREKSHERQGTRNSLSSTRTLSKTAWTSSIRLTVESISGQRLDIMKCRFRVGIMQRCHKLMGAEHQTNLYISNSSLISL